MRLPIAIVSISVIVLMISKFIVLLFYHGLNEFSLALVCYAWGMTNLEALKSILTYTLQLPTSTITISLRPPLTHQSHRLYDVQADGRHLILKEFLKPEEFYSSPKREYHALKLLAPLDIAPQPVFFQPQSPDLNPIVIYEFMEGEMWDRKPPNPDQLTQLAGLWLLIHSVKTDDLWVSRGYGNYDDLAERFDAWFQVYVRWATEHYPAGLGVVDIWRGLLEQCRVVNRQGLRMDRVEVFCRADPRFANVIQRPDGRLGMVDWEDSGLRDPAMDIADMMSHPNQEDLLSEADWQGFLKPYLTERQPLDPGMMDRVLLYRFLFPMFNFSGLLGYGVSMARVGKLNGWQINGMPANDRLRRFLARCLAWPETDFEEELEQVQAFIFFPKT
jgi:aminoglycoside phosphotransferase (APT) family kinase protein